MKMVRFIKTTIAIFILFFVPFSIFGFDFSVSPNEDGSADVYVSHRWYYTPALFTTLKAEYRNSFEEQSGTTDDGSEYYTTVGKTLSFSSNLLGAEFTRNQFFLSLAGNISYEQMDLRELGYTDQYNSSADEVVRFFILNDRNIYLTLPMVTFESGYKSSFARISVGGEYSPWLFVNLEQELTISPGLDKTSFSSKQSAQNAYSLNSSLRIFTPYVQPEFFVEYDYLDITYDVLTANGEAEVDTANRTLRLRGTLIPRVVNLKGIFPSISVVYEKDWYEDSVTSTTETDDNISFQFGFSM